MARRFTGRSEDAEAPFLGAEFWRIGKKISGRVDRVFDSKNGACYVLKPVDGAAIDGDEVDSVSVGNLTGFRMALQAAGCEKLLPGDMLSMECTSISKTDKGNDRPNFAVEIVRP